MFFSFSAASLVCLSTLLQICRSHPVSDCDTLLYTSTTAVISSPTPDPAAKYKPFEQLVLQSPSSQYENEKYFHENYYNNHYDARYFSHVLSEPKRQANLRYLVQTYLLFTQDVQVETWLMHGTLLGWWWNKKILPWDNDADFMVMESDMKFLASYHNMTIHHFDLPIETATNGAAPAPTSSLIPTRRDASARAEQTHEIPHESSRTHGYLLDVNPSWPCGSTADRHNAIDARWIDTTTGLYIDLTTLRRNPLDPAGELIVKDRHHYNYTDLFPLQPETFEGVPTLVPRLTDAVLAEEYGEDCLTTDMFLNHQFDYDKQLWLPIEFHWPSSVDTTDVNAQLAKLASGESTNSDEKAAARLNLASP